MFLFYCKNTWDLKFLSLQYNIVSYKHYVVQQVSRTQPSWRTEALYPLNNNSSFPPAPIHYSVFCFYVFGCFRFLSYVESCSIRPSVTGLCFVVSICWFICKCILTNISIYLNIIKTSCKFKEKMNRSKISKKITNKIKGKQLDFLAIWLMHKMHTQMFVIYLKETHFLLACQIQKPSILEIELGSVPDILGLYNNKIK